MARKIKLTGGKSPFSGALADSKVNGTGGKSPSFSPAKKVSPKGNPNVFAEAKARGSERINDKKALMRLDRPGRKRGGRCGADMSPLSGAGKTH